MALKKLLSLAQSDNIAADLDDVKLLEIANKVISELELDRGSRSEWFEMYKNIKKIAMQKYEEKNVPFINSSNIRYPLITDAVIRFASRQYPNLIKGNKVVECAVISDDPTGEVQEAADLISKHMSSQLLVQSNSWESTMDRLLHVYPTCGVAYKKVCYDPVERKNHTDLCMPEDIIVNNKVADLGSARRITHVIYKHTNYIQSMMNLGLYSDMDIDVLKGQNGDNGDPDMLHELLEQHRYLDLDEDGYQEPYIVIVHKASQKILRIVPRFKVKNIHIEGTKVVYIKPSKYFVAYHFIPSPDGTYHSLGYGQLLYPLNHATNSIYNQLVDSGSLHNMQGGFVLKGVRVKNGEIVVNQGKWNVVDAPNMSLKESIMEFPTKEPSSTLMKLLEFTLEAGKELGSITDVTQGQGQTQNVPATTVLTLLKQGMIVPDAIQKRLWRSLKEEFEILAELNADHMDDFEDFKFAGSKYRIYKQYYQMSGVSIEPVADPNAGSDAAESQRAQGVLQTIEMLSPTGKQEALNIYYKKLGIPAQIIQKLLASDPNPQPSPDAIKAQMAQKELELKGHKDMVDQMLKKGDMQLKSRELDQKQQELEATLKSLQADVMVKLSSIDNNKQSANLKAHELLLKKESLEHDKKVDAMTSMLAGLDKKLKMLDLIIKNKGVDNAAQQAIESAGTDTTTGDVSKPE